MSRRAVDTVGHTLGQRDREWKLVVAQTEERAELALTNARRAWQAQLDSVLPHLVTPLHPRSPPHPFVNPTPAPTTVSSSVSIATVFSVIRVCFPWTHSFFLHFLCPSTLNPASPPPLGSF